MKAQLAWPLNKFALVSLFQRGRVSGASRAFGFSGPSASVGLRLQWALHSDRVIEDNDSQQQEEEDPVEVSEVLVAACETESVEGDLDVAEHHDQREPLEELVAWPRQGVLQARELCGVDLAQDEYLFAEREQDGQLDEHDVVAWVDSVPNGGDQHGDQLRPLRVEPVALEMLRGVVPLENVPAQPDLHAAVPVGDLGPDVVACLHHPRVNILHLIPQGLVPFIQPVIGECRRSHRQLRQREG